MLRLMHLCVGLGLLVGSVNLSQDKKSEEKKTDTQATVKEGTEVTLTPVEVKLAERPDGLGRFKVTVKAKDPTKVKMPAQTWSLGFQYKPEPAKGGGVEIAAVPEGSQLLKMRPEPQLQDSTELWQAEAGDVITHVNGYAVNTIEELLVALTTAPDKSDVPIVLKDVNTGDLTAFYVTAAKR